MKQKMNLIYPDYKRIREESCRIDCTVAEADFYTSRPNPYRVAATASDVNRYLKRKIGGKL